MKTIWKYTLHVANAQSIKIPKNAEMLTVQMQGGEPQLWVLVDPEETKVDVIIEIYGTGHPINKEKLEYINTFQEGDLVFHVFKKL